MSYFDEASVRMYDFIGEIFNLNRSLTGQGCRDTLKCIDEYIGDAVKLKVHSIPSGTAVSDWTIPKEWVIREAYIEDEAGNHIIDMKNHNLHVLGYSAPVDEWVELEELIKHIYTEDSQPDVIPYVTSYYKERYGFCMSKNQLDSLKSGRYHMYVDSEFIDGTMEYADVVIPGDSEEEIFFSTYFCHPSMANNECSGIALASELIRLISSMSRRRYTYRFVFNPETIGSIAYLSKEGHLDYFKKNMKAGFVLSCVGDNGDYSIIESKYADTFADNALKSVIRFKDGYKVYDFHERGSDERQYNAAGVDLPVVCYCRSKFGEYLEYHTSADNMNFISPAGLKGSLEAMTELIEVLENNAYYRMKVLCEPQLGKRGLYPDVSRKGSYDEIMTQRDVISYADGRNDIIDMSNRFNVPPSEIIKIIGRLLEADLIEAVNE